jgi:hypothetical protein
MNGRALIPALAAVFLCVGACTAAPTGAVIALPNGYYLQPTKSGGLAIEKTHGREVVPGPVAAYAVVRQIVTGALGEPPPLHRHYTNDLPYKGGPDTRYFLLDTSTGKLDSGLDEAAWTARMKALNLPSPLELHSPIFPE